MIEEVKKIKIKNISVRHEGSKYTLTDMSDWFMQIRTFRSILTFGKGKNERHGEGQYGGRLVSDFAKEVEKKFIEKLGKDKYIENMDILMGKLK